MSDKQEFDSQIQPLERGAQTVAVVTIADLAACAHKLANTLYRRASTDPSFPEPIGVVRVNEKARRCMAFQAETMRHWIAKEIERRQLDPAVLERFDALVTKREAKER